MENNFTSNDPIQIGESENPLRRGDPLHSYSWRSSFSKAELINSEAFYSLRSNVKVSKFFLIKKLELFLFGLPELEYGAIVDLPGFFQDDLFVQCLAAKAELSHLPLNVRLPRQKLLLRQLQRLQFLLGRPSWSENLLYTYKGELRYELTLENRRIRKVKKYSGYCKTPSAVGAKRLSQSSKVLPETSNEVSYVRRNLIPFLLSQNEDYSLLGFNAKSPLYSDLLRTISKGRRLTEFQKQLIIFEPSDYSPIGNLLI